MLRGMKALLKFVVSLAANDYAATVTTTAVDNAGYRAMCFLIEVGTFTFTGVNKITVTMEECDTIAGTYTVVSANDIYNPENGTIAKVLDGTEDQNAVHAIHYRGYKQFTRLVLTEAGTVAVPLAVTAVLGLPNAQPPA